MEPPRTPRTKRKREEPDTVRRTRFFNVYDEFFPDVSLTKICQNPEIDIAPSTGRNWLRQREELGDTAYRKIRKLSQSLGRPRQLGEHTLDRLLERENPAHNLGYQKQVETLDLPVSAYTLRRNLSKRKSAKRYKKPRTKAISPTNKKLRVQYGRDHENKSVRKFWQYVFFTDEKHFRSRELSTRQEYELRQLGSEQRLEALQEENEAGLDVVLHVAAGISYHGRGDLIFYKDPVEPELVRAYNKARPRKSKVETAEDYDLKVKAWEEDNPSKERFEPKGNSITQVFYAK